jgi:hypothetical protein
MKALITFFLCFISFGSFASNDSLQVQKKYKRVYFYSAGLQAFGPEMRECQNKQAEKMGFGYKRKGGCIIRPLKYARLHAHNYRVEKKLVKRFGDNWHDQYNKLLADCKN